MLRTFCTGVAALAFAASLSAAPEIEVDIAKQTGTINRKLAGVSQGGNAGSFFKPAIRKGLEGLPLPLVRIEMITNSRPHALYDASTGKFNWTKLDEEIEAVRKAGGEVIINLFGTPQHLASDPAAKVPAFTPPKDFRAYAEFCAEIVRHVNIDRKYGVKYWEFWNEPSGSWFWTDWKNGNRRFFELYGMVANAVKQADPGALVGGFGDNAQYPEHYAGWFRYLKENPAPLDFITIHYYGDWAGKNGTPAPQNYVRFAERMQELCRRELGRELPLFYTEWNLPAESVNRFPAAQVAAWTGYALAAMQEYGKIDGAAFFRIEHYRDPASSLLDPQGNRRTASRVLQAFAELPEQQLAVPVSPEDTAVLAAGNADAAAVLISRYAPAGDATAMTVPVRFRNLRPDAAYTVSIAQEDSTSASRLGASAPQEQSHRSDEEGNLTIPVRLEPFSVAGLTLRR